MTKNCVVCGRWFSGHGLAMMCSSECKATRRAKKLHEWHIKNRPSVISVGQCESCGEDFIKNRPQTLTCSKGCFGDRIRSLKRWKMPEMRRYMRSYLRQYSPSYKRLPKYKKYLSEYGKRRNRCPEYRLWRLTRDRKKRWGIMAGVMGEILDLVRKYT